MPEDRSNHRVERSIRWTLIVLAAVLLVLLVFLCLQYYSLRRQQIMTTRALHWSFILQDHAPLAVSSADVIRSWMTFDYINRLFALPPPYLANQLAIGSSTYPRVTISGYAKSHNLDETTFLNQVESAVRDYVSANGSSADATSSKK